MGATHYLKLDKLLQYLEERYVKENVPAVLFDRKSGKYWTKEMVFNNREMVMTVACLLV